MGKRSKNSEGVETIEAVTENTSTGAREFPAEPVTLEATHLGAEPLTNHAPSGPVTMTASWLSSSEAKVVTPTETDGPAHSAVAETK